MNTTPKQYTVGASKADKTLVSELCREFTRHGAVKETTVNPSEREMMEVLLKVASDRRFQSKNGETTDLFETEWQAIIERDHSEKGITQLEKLKAQLAAKEAELEALKASV